MTKICKKCSLNLSEDKFYPGRRVCKKCYINKQIVVDKSKTIKTCKHCQEELPIEEFRQRRSICKQCFNSLRKVVTTAEGDVLLDEFKNNISYIIKSIEEIKDRLAKLDPNGELLSNTEHSNNNDTTQYDDSPMRVPRHRS